jgi:hypothetical protein
VIVWPLLAAALASAISASGVDRRAPALLATAILAALTCAWLGALFHQMLQGLDFPALAALPTWLAALVLWPLIAAGDAARVRFAPSLALLVLSIGLALFIGLRDPWTARHPRAVEPVYIVNPAAGLAWRASLLPLDAWTTNVLREGGGAILRLSLPTLSEQVDAAPAAIVRGVVSPGVTATTAADGTVTVTATPHADAAWITLALRPAARLTNITINGASAGLESSTARWSRIRWSGATPVVVRFRPTSAAAVEIVAEERFDRWLAARPLPPRPPTREMWDIAGSTLVVGRPLVSRAPPN